ncbi:CoA-binding protein [Luteimonas gilva]|uniref:CoA-binding protein n=1 Tax=Luteimonas gilva TaxID=2572684 RepID=A0A4U5JXH3_9GAMM|nr:CoA-binding protein [Luteimonas gilva]TKR33448.1 CoA-binding protein [Luteimonas gilva]
MRGSLIQNHRDIDRLLAQTRRIAVLGIKPEDRMPAPAHMIPAYMNRAGYEIVPVPVYYPDVSDILGKPVHRSVADVPGRVDVVTVFRKPEDLEPHLDDLLKARPRAVWLQTGIRHDAFAERLLAAGIDVVQDQCMMVEHRRWRSGA